MSSTLPLTRAQSGIWFAQQRDPGSPAFHCAEYVRISGPMDAAALELLRRALRRVVAETGTLTARFDAGVPGAEGEPRQVLGAAFDDPIRILDLSGEPDPEAAAQRVMRDATEETPDLERGGLCTAMILTLGHPAGGGCCCDVLLYLRAHHIVLDGFGFSSVIRRTARVFTAYERGEEPSASPFAPLDALLAEEQDYRASPDFAADRAFWADRLAGRGRARSLADRAQPAARDVLRHGGTLPRETAHALDTTARTHGVAWPELTLAVAAAYVGRITGSADVVLGLPVLARTGSAAAKVPTTTVNVLPLPLTIGEDDDLPALARSVHDGIAAARAHQRYRHEDLRRDLGLVGGNRRLSGPQINIKPFGYPLRFGGRRAAVHYLAAGPVEDIELTVHTAAPDGALGFDMTANPHLYGPDELAAHHARLHELVTRAATGTAPGPVRTLDVATRAELRMIDACNDTGHDVDPATLIDRIEAAARRTPGAPALRFRGETLTYAELDARADRLAALLRREHGIGGGDTPGGAPCDIVAVALPRSFELVVALIATLKCGAAYLPVDPDYPDGRIAYLLDHARPGCVVTTGAEAARLPDTPAAPVVRLDAPAVAAALAAPADPVTRPSDLLDRPAYVIYTSGSTGAPKGVVVGHRAIVNRLAWMQHAFGLGADDRVLQKTPSGFDVSVWEFFWPLMTGAVLVLAEPGGHRDPAYLAGLIADEDITTIHFVPSMLEAFCGEPSLKRRPGTTPLRRIVCSGEALDAGLADAAESLLGAPVFNLYGPTEAAVDVSWWRHAAGSATVPIGHPVWNTRLHVLDPAMRPTPPGVAGDLYLGGVQLADGYLQRPDLTRERFVPDPFGRAGERLYRTGDQARRRSDGALEYLGRDDDQVKIRGVRIEPAEIAAVLRGLGGVAQAAVVATRAGGDGPMMLVGYAVPEDGATIDPAAVRRGLAERLPAAMVPAHIVPLAALPVTANGKLDRSALPAPQADGNAAHTASEAPRSPREQALCELMADVLGLGSVAPTDDFFDLGGHSLAAVALVRRIRDALGADVSVGTVFAAPHARSLAAELDAGTPDRSLDVLFPLRSGAGSDAGAAEADPALYCVHPAGGLGWCYAGLARRLPPGRPVMAVQARGLDGRTALPAGIEAMAAEYVTAIRGSGDEGPYHLLGWSVGGVIAQEMAVQIQQSGGTVASLTLLDAYPGDQWRGLAAPTEDEALRALLHMAGQDPDEGPGSGRAAVMDRLRRGGSALGSLGEETLSAVIDIVTNNARLMREHEHRVFKGDVLFFTAAAPRAESWLHRDAWLPHVSGVIEGHDLPLTHPEMIRAAALDTVGPVLAERLRLGDAQGG
ncbi:non-ribosomal peptide synthetase [Tomitella gaofuii]|uniref:non-ribosomal peptide synthetase n=1 Tax=Tomitella gaofuii TaxID=2760083 RepID=UPI0015FC7ACB|nr:non-ribosomal peptide synthetase [Tomitella gaofuii]